MIKKLLIKLTKKICGKEILFYEKIKQNDNNIKLNNRIVIEVGANSGVDTINFLKKGYTVYCFEPTPELCVVLQNKLSNYKNFFLIPLAVDVSNSFRKFNIAKHNDWGVSSFYEFHDEITNKKKWSHRRDFYFDQKIITMTIRLDTFLEIFKIRKKISYLWTDTQGNDLRVLKSLGKKIYQVQKGKCEASYKTRLYKGINNDHQIIKNFLKEKKFKTHIIEDGDGGMECDIHFTR